MPWSTVRYTVASRSDHRIAWKWRRDAGGSRWNTLGYRGNSMRYRGIRRATGGYLRIQIMFAEWDLYDLDITHIFRRAPQFEF